MSEKVGLAVKKPESKGKETALAKTKTGFSPSVEINSPVDKILHLQRTIGNQAVSRLIRSGVLQAKLTIGRPGDIYEQEADQVADRVMRMTEQGIQRQPSCPGCEEEETPISRKESGSCGGADVMSCVESHINALKGGGQSLSPSTRGFFEPRFGSDFSHVRVHTGSDAAAIATEINAKAFTTGNDIFFNTGQYSPGTSSGKSLLAHELTHVLQQHPGSDSSLQMIRKIDNGNIFLQRYSLNGFSTTDAKTMNTAIASAISTVKSCKALSWYGQSAISSALASKRYDYVKDLGYCGWTFPGSWYIEVGPSAFTSSCCRLDSTLAHEAAHTELYTEGAAYKMECDCFKCGCSK